MADNTQLDPGTGGDTIRDKDRAGVKTPVVGLDINPAGSEVLGTGDATNGLDVDVTRVQGTVTVNGSGVTQPISAAALPLPTGASTAAKQPALGTAGTPSADVISVQGVASMTAVKVDGSGVTQPVSGTVTASGPLTDTQLRATPVPVSGTVTASGPLTDTQLRATTVPVADSQVIADNAGFTDGTSKVFPVGLIFDEVAGTALTENDIGAARMDAKRAAVSVLEDATTRGQRAAVSAGGALKVDNSAVTQPVSGTVTANLGTAAVTNAGTFAVQIAANSSVNQAQVAGTATDTNSGVKSAGTQRVVLATDQPQLTNALKVDPSAVTSPVSLASLPALAAGSALAGRMNLDPQTANGLSIFHLVSAATTNATNLKASAGQVYGWYIYNSNAAARKVAFHNTAGTPTAGASIAFAIVIPPSSAANVEFTNGIAFATGIAITTVTDLTDAGTTAVALNDLVINILFK